MSGPRPTVTRPVGPAYYISRFRRSSINPAQQMSQLYRYLYLP